MLSQRPLESSRVVQFKTLMTLQVAPHHANPAISRRWNKLQLAQFLKLMSVPPDAVYACPNQKIAQMRPNPLCYTQNAPSSYTICEMSPLFGPEIYLTEAQSPRPRRTKISKLTSRCFLFCKFTNFSSLKHCLSVTLSRDVPCSSNFLVILHPAAICF